MSVEEIKTMIDAAKPFDAEAGKARVELVKASDIQPQPVRWLWRNWLAAGKLHIMAGSAGTGKTTLATSLAAIITTGGYWPDGTHAKAGDVLMWSSEDAIFMLRAQTWNGFSLLESGTRPGKCGLSIRQPTCRIWRTQQRPCPICGC